MAETRAILKLAMRPASSALTHKLLSFLLSLAGPTIAPEAVPVVLPRTMMSNRMTK